VAESRLSLTSNGDIRYRLKTPYRDGSTGAGEVPGQQRLMPLSRQAFAMAVTLLVVPALTLSLLLVNRADGIVVPGAPRALLQLAPVGRFISRAFAASVTRPLETLVAQIDDHRSAHIELPLSERSSREVIALQQALDRARRLARRFLDTLEKEVERKTEALRRANSALQELALEDPLTRIYNRRGLQLRPRCRHC